MAGSVTWDEKRKRAKVRVYVGTDGGREIVRSKTFAAPSLSAAKKLAAAKYIPEILSGRQDEVSYRGTVAGLVDEWLGRRRQVGAKSDLATVARICARIKERLGSIPLDRLTRRDLDDFYLWLRTTEFAGQNRPPRRLSESTVHHHHRIVNAIIQQGVEWERLPASVSPSKATKPRAADHRPEPPSLDDVRVVLDAIKRDSGLKVMFALFAKTGCRRGELCAARWSDINWAAGELRIERSVTEAAGKTTIGPTKTKTTRNVYLDDDTVALLRAWRGDLERQVAANVADATLAADAYIMPDILAHPGGRAPMSPRRISQAWARAAKRTGVRARLHDLRHWHATQLLHAGVALPAVSRQLGHSRTSTTADIYAHVVQDGAIAKAMGALPLPVNVGVSS